jgi:hypothetical protein
MVFGRAAAPHCAPEVRLFGSRRAIRGSLRSYLRALRALGTRQRRAATIPLAAWRETR